MSGSNACYHRNVQKRLGMKSLRLLLLLVSLGVTASGGGGTLPLNTAGTATTVRRVERKVDVLLRVETNNERGDVDDLLADTDVALADEDTGVVDRLGERELGNLGLETTLKEVLGLEGKDVVETHARVVEHTNADETADKSVTLEETLGVLVVELEELTSSTTDLFVSGRNWLAALHARSA